MLLTRRLRILRKVFLVIKMKSSRKFYGRHHEMGTMTKYLYHEYFWRDSCCSVLCFVNDYLSFYLISFRHCLSNIRLLITYMISSNLFFPRDIQRHLRHRTTHNSCNTLKLTFKVQMSSWRFTSHWKYPLRRSRISLKYI